MIINHKHNEIDFSKVPAGGIFSYNGYDYIALIREYTDDNDGDTFNAIDLNDGTTIYINDTDIVTYYSDATLNL